MMYKCNNVILKRHPIPKPPTHLPWGDIFALIVKSAGVMGERQQQYYFTVYQQAEIKFPTCVMSFPW